jgi:hypothetical protein
MRKLLATSCGFVLVAAIGVAAQKKDPDLMVPLKFTPQESVTANSVALPTSVLDRVLEIRVQDARDLPDLKAIGAGLDDGEVKFAIKSTIDVVPFVSESFATMAAAQSLKKGAAAERVLQLRLTRFNVNASKKALGATYLAEMHFAVTLLDAAGQPLYEGAVAGTTSRYGRGRSTANVNEVVSDALKDAFTKTIGEPALQQAWGSGKPATPGAPASAQPAAAAPAASIEERLKTLDDLLKKGLITTEEHATRRAAILKEI